MNIFAKIFLLDLIRDSQPNFGKIFTYRPWPFCTHSKLITAKNDDERLFKCFEHSWRHDFHFSKPHISNCCHYTRSTLGMLDACSPLNRLWPRMTWWDLPPPPSGQPQRRPHLTMALNVMNLFRLTNIWCG